MSPTFSIPMTSGGRLPTIPVEPDADWTFGTVLKPVGMPWSDARGMYVANNQAVVLRDDGDVSMRKSPELAVEVGEIIRVDPRFWEPAE